MQDNNFPALTEHRRDSGPLQAWPATVAFEKRVLCRGLELAVFFRSRFESLHPGKCVGKQVSPPGCKVGRGPVPCSRCKPAWRFRNSSVLPVTREDT